MNNERIGGTSATNKWANLIGDLFPGLPGPVFKKIAAQPDGASAAAVARAHMTLAELADIKPDPYALSEMESRGRTRG